MMNGRRYDYEEEEEAAAAAAANSGCFSFCCFDGQRWNRLQGGEEQREEGETWFVNKVKEVKEFSEVVAGPKWKNFIRKMGKYTKKTRMAELRQYDPQSYALNFDDGADYDEEFQQHSNTSSPLINNSAPPPVVATHHQLRGGSSS